MPKQLTFDECGPFEIIDIEVNGRPQRVWKHLPPHYRAWLLTVFKQHPDRVFISCAAPEPAPKDQRERYTYAEVFEKSIRLAAWLRSKGVKLGDHVAVGGGNSAGWVTAWTAAHLIGAVPVTLNSTLQLDAQGHCLNITHPVIVLVDAPLAGRLGPHRDKLDKRVGPIYAWSSIAHLPADARAGVHEIGDATSSQAFIDGVRNGTDLENLGPDSGGNIFFTSGTTGYPKAVWSTQRQALHSVLSSPVAGLRAALRAGLTLEQAAAMTPQHQQSMLVPTPLFHTTGCHAVLMRCMATGAKVVFMRYWSVSDAVKLIIEEKVTLTGGVPAIVTSLLKSPDLPKDHVFEGLNYGGAPPPERLASDLQKRWPGIGLIHGFGMTEMNGAHVGIVGMDYVQRPSAVGHAIPVGKIKIVDPDTKEEMPRGEMGLLMAYGMNIMTCYYGNPDATAKAFDKDGWLDTGDLGFIDDEGFLYLRDRAKDIIIRGGENIACAEVENALYLDDRIAEAAAVPVPDAVLGERVGVCVSLNPGAKADAESIIAAAEPRLRRDARPVVVVIHSEPLPRNANGKILKNELRVVAADAWKLKEKDFLAKEAKAKAEAKAAKARL